MEKIFKYGRKNKAYKWINIIGLSLGLTGLIIFTLFFNYENNYDKWSPALRRVYQIEELNNFSNTSQYAKWDNICDSRIGFSLRTGLPGIQELTMVEKNFWGNDIGIQVNNKVFEAHNMLDSDSSFFKVFPYKFIEGNRLTALNSPHTMVISRELAKKWFNATDVVGKTISMKRWNDETPAPYEITGVMEIPKKPSSLSFSAVFHTGDENKDIIYAGATNLVKIYALLYPHQNLSTLSIAANKIYQSERKKLTVERQAENISGIYSLAKGQKPGIRFQPLSDIHLHPVIGKSMEKEIFSLLAISLLLLIIAIANFVNLSTVLAVYRIKEISIRKIMGASRLHLILQLLTNTAIDSVIALILSIAFTILILPIFNHYFNINISLWENIDIVRFGLDFLLIILVTTLLSGIYPAVFLANYKPVRALRLDMTPGSKGIVLRNALIVLQFSIAIVFIIFISIISRQLNYAMNSDLGFHPQGLLSIQASENTGFVNQIRQLPNIQYLGVTSQEIGKTDPTSAVVKYQGQQFKMNYVNVGYETFKVMKVKLLSGRLFSKEFGLDSVNSVIINKSAADLLGVRLIGKSIYLSPANPAVEQNIVGIIDDYHFQGFEKKISPTIYAIDNEFGIAGDGTSNILIKLNGNVQQGINQIEKIWSSFYPGYPFQYSYLDETYKQLETEHVRLRKIFSLFATISILLSIIGLFALTTLMIKQHTKELGIRKVLGGTTYSLLKQINKKYVALIIVANFIAYPVVYILAKDWLNQYAYKIKIPLLPFIITTLLSLIICSLIISLQTWNISRVNPVEALRVT